MFRIYRRVETRHPTKYFDSREKAIESIHRLLPDHEITVGESSQWTFVKATKGTLKPYRFRITPIWVE